MSITEETVKHVATLARLTLSDEEVRQYTKDLSQIMGLVDELNTMDFSQLEADGSFSEFNPVLREDVAKREYSRESLLANAPEQEDNSFQVPKILSDDD